MRRQKPTHRLSGAEPTAGEQGAEAESGVEAETGSGGRSWELGVSTERRPRRERRLRPGAEAEPGVGGEHGAEAETGAEAERGVEAETRDSSGSLVAESETEEHEQVPKGSSCGPSALSLKSLWHTGWHYPPGSLKVIPEPQRRHGVRLLAFCTCLKPKERNNKCGTKRYMLRTSASALWCVLRALAGGLCYLFFPPSLLLKQLGLPEKIWLQAFHPRGTRSAQASGTLAPASASSWRSPPPAPGTRAKIKAQSTNAALIKTQLLAFDVAQPLLW